MIKIFYDHNSNQCIFTGLKDRAPRNEMDVIRSGDLISIYSPLIEDYYIQNMHYSNIRNQAGSGFASAIDCENYLNAELNGLQGWDII